MAFEIQDDPTTPSLATEFDEGDASVAVDLDDEGAEEAGAPTPCEVVGDDDLPEEIPQPDAGDESGEI